MSRDFADWLNKNLPVFLDRWSAWVTYYRMNNYRWPDGIEPPVPKIYLEAELNQKPADLIGYLRDRYLKGEEFVEIPPMPPSHSETLSTYGSSASKGSVSVGEAALHGAAKGAVIGAGLALLLSRLIR